MRNMKNCCKARIDKPINNNNGCSSGDVIPRQLNDLERLKESNYQKAQEEVKSSIPLDLFQ